MTVIFGLISSGNNLTSVWQFQLSTQPYKTLAIEKKKNHR